VSAGASTLERLEQFARSFDLPAVVAHAVQEAAAQWPRALPSDVAANIRRIVISGCGDSLFAGLACRHAIERFSGLPCEALDALECGRYAAARFGPDVLLLAISNSGSTSRVIESVRLGKRAGARCLALTGAADAPLCAMAHGSVVRSVAGIVGRQGPTSRVERHLAEYVSTLVVLYQWALHLGVARDVLSAAERRREVAALEAAGEVAGQALARVEPVATVLTLIGEADRVFYLGAGPSFGTASFGAAKLLEEIPLCSIPQQLEEWAHEQYFLTMIEGARSRVIVVAPPGDATDRAAEILRSIRAQGGIAIAVTGPREAEIQRHAAATIAVPGDCWEGYSPIPYAVPMQLLGVGLAFQGGRTVVPLGRQDEGRLIRASVIRS